MSFNKVHNVYLIGIGGIGMSAIARYFNSKGIVGVTEKTTEKHANS